MWSLTGIPSDHVTLFRPENVPLETEEARLGQQFQKLSGSLMVNFHGEEKTLVQMGRYQEEPDRALRQEAWECVAHRRLQEADKFDDLFDALVQAAPSDRPQCRLCQLPGLCLPPDGPL